MSKLDKIAKIRDFIVFPIKESINEEEIGLARKPGVTDEDIWKCKNAGSFSMEHNSRMRCIDYKLEKLYDEVSIKKESIDAFKKRALFL